jgi:hypothetical protein
MYCDSTQVRFVVRTTPPYKNYDPENQMVRCPCGCKIRVAISVILEVWKREQNAKLDQFINNVQGAWAGDKTREEQR